MTLATPEDNAGASISNGLDRQTGLTAEIDAKGLSGAVANRAGRSGPRFSIIPGNAVFDENLTLTGFRLLCYLGRHTNNAGWCRIKQRKIAADLGIARSTVQIHLDQLYKLGWVEKRAEGWTGVDPDPEGQPFACHSYRVCMEASATGGEVALIDDEVPDDEPDKSGTTCPTYGQGT